MKRVKRVQKLAKREESVILKRIFWLTIFSVILVVVLFSVGLNFLGGFADFTSSIFNQDTEENISSTNNLNPPILDTLPKITNEQRITVKGFSSGGNTVEIYIDGSKVDQTEIVNGQFEFSDILLSVGDNDIALKAVDNDGNSSEFSATITVALDKEPPDLEVTAPEDGKHFSGDNRVKISGVTESEAQVFAQGFLANVSADGEFEVTIPLELEGENKIEVKAVDEAGNVETKELKLHFQK